MMIIILIMPLILFTNFSVLPGKKNNENHCSKTFIRDLVENISVIYLKCF